MRVRMGNSRWRTGSQPYVAGQFHSDTQALMGLRQVTLSGAHCSIWR